MKFKKLSLNIMLICLLNNILQIQYVYSQSKKSMKNENISNNNYTGSYYKDNYVWGGAMNLAWNDCVETIIKDKIELTTTDKNAISMVKKLNNSHFTTEDLDENSYYVKSGFGQAILEEINKESLLKFPNKTFEPLNDSLGADDFIAYAYLYKKIEFFKAFTPKEIHFKGNKVDGFYAEGIDCKRNVEIIEYMSDDKFIVSITLKEFGEAILFAKGYDMNNPEIVIKIINQKIKCYHDSLEWLDTFEAPKLNLDYRRDYQELLNKSIANKGFENYQIKKMYETFKFNLDETGVKVEEEAVIRPVTTSIGIGYKKPKHFNLDSPFWVIMEYYDSKRPYFILGVNNTALMNNKTN